MKFYYSTRDKSGKKITGFEEGSNQEEVIARLQARELIVIEVTPEQGVEAGASLTLGSPKVKARVRYKHYRVTSEDLMLFCRQLATLLGAGVTILKALEVISQQVASHKLFDCIRSLEKNMEAGLSMHEAMAKHPAIFSELWINLVESGEASGNLSGILSRLANYLERNESFKKKIISAMIYPVILTCAGFGALLFLTIKIIPTFATLFAGFNLKLPLLTQILVDISAFLRKFLLLIVIGLAAGFYLLRRYIKTRPGRIQYETFKFKLPVFGEFFRALTVERFSSEMSTLIESGVPILYALEISERSVGSLIVGDIIRKIKEDVRSGKSLRQPMEQSGYFEPLVVQMIAVGEEIGELAPMFHKINVFYEEYVETFLGRFTSMFEPFVLLFMGLVIGIMVIGMFLPIFQISQIGR